MRTTIVRVWEITKSHINWTMVQGYVRQFAAYIAATLGTYGVIDTQWEPFVIAVVMGIALIVFEWITGRKLGAAQSAVKEIQEALPNFNPAKDVVVEATIVKPSGNVVSGSSTTLTSEQLESLDPVGILKERN